jgi:hypothetical protein
MIGPDDRPSDQPQHRITQRSPLLSMALPQGRMQPMLYQQIAAIAAMLAPLGGNRRRKWAAVEAPKTSRKKPNSHKPRPHENRIP